jgi:flagellar hook-associated protein 2
VIQTNGGPVLQVASAKSGQANSFSVSGTESTAQTVVAAQDAVATVGDPAHGGYSVSSSSNTFTSLIPGVTFSANALASNVTITVGSDEQSISNKVQALVDAANDALTEIGNDTAKGAPLEGQYDALSIATAIKSAVSGGVQGGGSLKTYGVDLDSTGQLNFDPTVFASAYGADPAGTQTALSGSFATTLDTTASAAVAPTTGTITSAIASATTRSTNLSTEISKWTDRLTDIKNNLTAKFSAMETALAKLQSQQTYLNSMFDSINKSSSSSSSGS